MPRWRCQVFIVETRPSKMLNGSSRKQKTRRCRVKSIQGQLSQVSFLDFPNENKSCHVNNWLVWCYQLSLISPYRKYFLLSTTMSKGVCEKRSVRNFIHWVCSTKSCEVTLFSFLTKTIMSLPNRCSGKYDSWYRIASVVADKYTLSLFHWSQMQLVTEIW